MSTSIGVYGTRDPALSKVLRDWDKLAHLMVRTNMWRLRLWFDYEDLFTVAQQGLWRAHISFDPDNGANFQTFARRVITNAFNALHHYSRANVRRDRIRSLSIDDDSDGTTFQHPSDCVPADLKVISDQEASLVRSSLDGLKTRDRQIILDRLVRERTLEEVGKDVGLTRERVRQIEKAALLKVGFDLGPHFSAPGLKKPSLRIPTGRRSKR